MDSISNSGVSLILNPDIANGLDEHQHHHDLSTCEEEFENPEEIQQMLANAFDSQSLSNTDNDAHEFDDDDEAEPEEEEEKELPTPKTAIDDVKQSPEYLLLQQENENLRHRLSECTSSEEIHRRNALEHEEQINELKEKHEQKCFSLRLEYDTKFEQTASRSSEQQIEMLTLKQMYETIFEEKCHVDEQLNDLRANEQNLQEKLEKVQMEYEQSVKANQKPLMHHVLVQTEVQEEMEELKRETLRLRDQIKLLQNEHTEREQIYSNEKIQYEKRIREISKRPMMTCVKLQTDFSDDEEKKCKQLQDEINDYKLKLNGKQIEVNSLKFDLDNLKHDMSERLSLLNSNLSTEQINKALSERDQYCSELNQLKTEVPQLKQQMIESFQTKVANFKEQVKKSLAEKENDYQRKLQEMENEYIAQYEQVLEKNRQIIRNLLASKQEEFQAEKNQLIEDYEAKLQKQQLSEQERRVFEQKIEELTRANDKCSQYIAKREHEHRHRDKLSLNTQQMDEAKRKYNDEIHRLYDQITKQNQQQLTLIDEHQKQVEQIKNTYDQRYRTLLDEWKMYNNDLHESNSKLKTKLKEQEKTIVQLRYHIINLQIEYLQNGGNSNKIMEISNEIK